MEEDIELLDLMLKDMVGQKAIYKPGPYWAHFAYIAGKKMRDQGVLNFRSHVSGIVGSSYTDCLIMDPTTIWDFQQFHKRILKKILALKLVKKFVVNPFIEKIESYEKNLNLYIDYFINTSLKEWVKEITQKYDLPESMVGGCGRTVHINNKPFSLHYLEAIARIYNFSSKVDFTKIKSVFEIGGGFGCNAHLLIHLFPNIKKYLYLDIPPYLYVGTQYLKHFFPTSVTDYRELSNRDIIHFSNHNNLEIIAITPWQMEKTKASVNCFWNSDSFVEMPMSSVTNYAKFIDAFITNDPSSFLCLHSYGDINLSTTFHPDKLIDIFQNNFQIEILEPSIRISPNSKNHYYLGKRKQI